MKTSQNHVPSLLSSIVFGLGGLFLLGIALLMGITALVSLVTGEEVRAEQTIFLIAFGFEAIILFLAAFFTLQKYLQRESADREVFLSLAAPQIIILIVITGVAILIGYLIADIRIANWLFLPLLTIPAIAIPLAVLLVLGTRKLPFGPRWQAWSVLGLGMTLGPLILFTLEIVIAVFMFIVVAAYVMTQPELVLEMQRLSQQILILGPQTEAARELLSPFLTRPAVMVMTLLYIAVLVPAVEEIFKPIGVWLFAGQLDSPAQGFALGALSGAGYGLIETIGVSGQQTSEWATLLFSRIGTGLLHITTSALVGAAIVLAWHERRYLRLFGTYLLAVLLHGFWNAFATIFTFSTLEELLEQPGPLSEFQIPTIVAMALLAVGLFVLLILSNRRWRQSLPPPLIEPIADRGTDADELI